MTFVFALILGNKGIIRIRKLAPINTAEIG